MIKIDINNDLKKAMKSRDKQCVGVLRLITSAFKQREVDERITLDNHQSIEILDKMLKQRRESLAIYDKAGRKDLADQEQYEILVIQKYLPQPLTDSEVEVIVDNAIAETSASSMKQMGAVIKIVKTFVQGRADMGQVSKLVKSKLS